MRLIIICTFYIIFVGANLDERLNKYDLFGHSRVKHVMKRRDLGGVDTKDMEFHSLGRDFKLNLVRHTSLFTKDFKVIAIDNEGERVIDFIPELYHGKLKGDPDSDVQFYMSDTGSFTSTISTKDKKYVFEPSWRYLPAGKNYSMIGYEEKDVNMATDMGEKYCEAMRPPDNKNYHNNKHNNHNNNHIINNNNNDNSNESDNEDDMDEGNNRNAKNNNAKNNNGYKNNNGNNNNNNGNNNNNNGNNNNNNERNGSHKTYHHPNKQSKDHHHYKKHQKRSSSSSCTKDNRMICTLMLVADYKFYVNIGNQDFHATTGYLISVIDQVNQIYKNQDFGSCGTGFQFEIREIRIHTEYSLASDSLYEYNSDKSMNTSQLLEYFSRNSNYNNFCLAHLFTHTPFPGGILGLAYIGSPRIGSLGGVCSSAYSKDGHFLYINTGWSSSVNKFGRALLAAEAYIVTAHELGHNWGSEHDVDNGECSPSSGKYIMYMYSVSGREENNRKFSPCSRRSMAALIRGKAYKCFSQKSGSFCGNYKVEEGEECDEGPDSDSGGGDGGVVGMLVATKKRCCRKCKLETFSQCSDINHQCCKDCSFAVSTTACMNEKEFQCKTGSHCSGVDTTCEMASNEVDGTDCLGGGKCKGGRCLTICEYNGMQPCICSINEDACKWCCRDVSSENRGNQSNCRPFQHSQLLPSGTPCYQGFCDKGVCQKQKLQNSIQRLWKIIENIDANKLVLFMRANIVGTVIVLSLVLWIPLSCLVSYIDKKRAKREIHEYEWRDPNNDQLLLPWKDSSRPKILNRDIKFSQI